jgi:hypothetical protein
MNDDTTNARRLNSSSPDADDNGARTKPNSRSGGLDLRSGAAIQN